MYVWIDFSLLQADTLFINDLTRPALSQFTFILSLYEVVPSNQVGIGVKRGALTLNLLSIILCRLPKKVIWPWLGHKCRLPNTELYVFVAPDKLVAFWDINRAYVIWVLILIKKNNKKKTKTINGSNNIRARRLQVRIAAFWSKSTKTRYIPTTLHSLN